MHGSHLPAPKITEISDLLAGHLQDLYALYGDQGGVRVARKHIGWYVRGLAGSSEFRQTMNRLDTAPQQLSAVETYLARLAAGGDCLTYVEDLAA
jgi:tRNA-dihydrouridine synthase B